MGGRSLVRPGAASRVRGRDAARAGSDARPDDETRPPSGGACGSCPVAVPAGGARPISAGPRGRVIRTRRARPGCRRVRPGRRGDATAGGGPWGAGRPGARRRAAGAGWPGRRRGRGAPPGAPLPLGGAWPGHRAAGPRLRRVPGVRRDAPPPRGGPLAYPAVAGAGRPRGHGGGGVPGRGAGRPAGPPGGPGGSRRLLGAAAVRAVEGALPLPPPPGRPASGGAAPGAIQAGRRAIMALPPAFSLVSPNAWAILNHRDRNAG